jgi:hypothetical protein
MSRIVDKILTQNNDNNKNKNNSYTYALVVVDQLSQLSQLRHAR